MGTNVLGDNIKAAIDALSEANKTNRTEVMRAIGNEVEDWHATYPPYEHDHDDRYYTEAEIAAILAGYAVVGHDHDLDYLGIGAKAANSELLDGIDSTGFSLAGHDHDADYLGLTAKAADSEKLDDHDSSYFSVSTHNHSGVYEPAFSKNSAFNKNFAGTGAATTVGRSDHNHNTTYLGISAKAADSEKVDNINGASLLRSDVDDIVSAHTEWQDNKQVRFGNDADFRMYHTGAIMYMRGYLHGAAFNIQGENASGVNKGLIYMDPDSYIRLHYAGSGKLETTSAGVAITGTLTVTTDTLVSNLNADKLDSQHASYFSVSTHNHSGVYLPIAGKAADSSKLNNAVESVTAGNNTIVKRHSSGYVFANYFNTTPNTVTSGVTRVCVEAGSDGYIRHGTQAAIRLFIGAGSGNGLDADKLDGLHASQLIAGLSGVKVGNFTIDGNGTPSITGVGFRPSIVIFFATPDNNATGQASWGFDDGSAHHCTFRKTAVVYFGHSLVDSICIYHDSATNQKAHITSMDSDGFTLTHTEINVVSLVRVLYLALP